MKIVIDSREQRPYRFQDCPFVEIICGSLQTGDYSLYGLEDRITIERKELSDLLSCLTHDRPRFTRELERLRGFESACVLVESSLAKIARGEYRSQVSPEAALQSLVSFMANYKVPFFFAENRDQGETFAFNFLRHFHRHAVERYKALADEMEK